MSLPSSYVTGGDPLDRWIWEQHQGLKPTPWVNLVPKPSEPCHIFLKQQLNRGQEDYWLHFGPHSRFLATVSDWPSAPMALDYFFHVIPRGSSQLSLFLLTNSVTTPAENSRHGQIGNQLTSWGYANLYMYQIYIIKVFYGQRQ